ncbi:AMP-binding protein [Rhodococcus sp. ARP2]|uniref:AMP-binding protein n=1 Tax=Rhodococcus sp. ARP2 TaxID=1661385 RepID=UPI00064C204E|nr:AMP-binding protein [Rhodococcus sp. ARP2]
MSSVLETSYFPADVSDPIVEQTVGGLLRECAADSPNLIAIREVVPTQSHSLSGASETDRTWTFAELLGEAEGCAHYLLSQFDRGDRITVWAPNIPEWMILQYGAALAGMVLVTANPALGAEELAYVLSQSQSRGLFHTGKFRGGDMAAVASEAISIAGVEVLAVNFEDWDRQVRGWTGERGALPEVSPDDNAQIQYTSGTTGVPKGALLHHRGLVNNADFVSRRGQFPERGSVVSAMPLFHTAGCGILVLGAAQRRMSIGLIQYFDPTAVLDAAERFRADVVSGVPTMLIAMINDASFASRDFSACSVVVSGGSSVPPELVSTVESAFGAGFSIVYGQTEASPVITQTSPADTPEDKSETVGLALPQVEVKISDVVTGDSVPLGEQGEICARGYLVMTEYFRNPEASAATVDKDGWLHTGDLGTMDQRGYVRVTGRLKDMIIRGGENIYPREVESVIFTHPKILDVAVVGVPDEVWGERVVAVIRWKDESDQPTAAELVEFCTERLARHKAPKEWFSAEAFPLTGSGKIQKYRIASLVGEGAYGVVS